MSRFYTILAISEALSIPKRTLSRRASQDCWDYSEENCRGGSRRLYLFDSLPSDVQAALILANPDEFRPAAESKKTKSADYDAASLWSHYERKTDKQKSKAAHKHRLISQAAALVDSGATWNDAFQAVCELDGSISWRTLRDIYHGKPGKTGLKKFSRSDWLAALVPGHVGRTARAEMSAEAWDYIRADYLRNERPGLPACYARLQAAAAEHGWTIPSLKTVERRIAAIPRAERVFLRDGEHGLLRLYPALERSVRDLHALQWVNADGYTHNVIVRWPDGTTGRPKTWFWQDVYSRRLLAWRTDETEHCDVIRLSFGDLVERYGIPDHVTIDNTRAAANKWLTGRVPNRYRFKIRDDDPLGVFPQLDIQVHWTSVQAGHGHGQAKPVERAFGIGGIGEYVDKHPRLAGAYTGPNPQEKPENYGDRAIPIEEFLEILEQGVRAWNSRENRATEICAGSLSFDQAFTESYESSLIRRATAEQRRLWLLTAESVRVQRDGSVVLEAGAIKGVGRNRYVHDKLLDHIGQKVIVRFDPLALHGQVYAYTLDGRFISSADCFEAAGFGDTERGRAHNRALRQKARAVQDQAAAQQRLDALAASRLLPDQPPADDPKPAVVRGQFRNRGLVVGSDVVAQPDESDQDLIDNVDDLILQIAAEEKRRKTIL